MNFYEHTIIARQDIGASQLKQIEEKYTNLVIKNEGKVLKTENWGLLNLSYLINPKTNLKLTIGIVLRDFKDEEIQQQTKIFNFGFKSDLFNNYYDF